MWDSVQPLAGGQSSKDAQQPGRQRLWEGGGGGPLRFFWAPVWFQSDSQANAENVGEGSVMVATKRALGVLGRRGAVSMINNLFLDTLQEGVVMATGQL